jgi:hypothetical protein
MQKATLYPAGHSALCVVERGGDARERNGHIQWDECLVSCGTVDLPPLQRYASTWHNCLRVRGGTAQNLDGELFISVEAPLGLADACNRPGDSWGGLLVQLLIKITGGQAVLGRG